MRILIASNVYPPNFIGGAELIAHHQATQLREMGHEVEVFAGEIEAFGKHGDLRSDFWDGISVHRISMLPQDYDPNYVNFTNNKIEGHFKKILDRFRPDIFHGHNLIGLSVALPRLATLAGARAVVTLHDHWGFCFKNTILKKRGQVCQDFSRCGECLPTVDDGEQRGIPIRMRNDFLALMLSEADALVSPSRYLARAYVEAGFPESLLRVVPNGIEVERFGRLVRGQEVKRKSRDLRLAYVGGLYSHKGLVTLCEALGFLPHDCSIQLDIVGTGDQRQVCERILQRNDRTDWVNFLGRIPNERIEEVYETADVLVLPSIWPENQPVSITEAMASGRPAIVSDLGGSKELVDDGRTGKVFRAGDPRDLARCIKVFAQNPSLIGEYGKEAYRKIAPQTIHNQTKTLLKLYRSLKGERQSRAISSRRLVICSGFKLENNCSEIMAAFPAKAGWQFVHRDWIDEGLFAEAWLHWVLDRDCSPTRSPKGHGTVPTLLSIDNENFHTADWDRGLVLVYGESSQAIRWIRYLADLCGEELESAQLM